MAVTLCGASWYNQKYFFNPEFDRIPKEVQEELQILCVSFTEDVGGVLTIEFGGDELPHFTVRSAEGDPRFDEIGSELRIRKLQEEKAELMQQLAAFYRIFILGKLPREGGGDA